MRLKIPSQLFAFFALLLLAAADKPQRHGVTIDNSAYSPQTLEIAAGDVVVWTNNDDRDHTVTCPAAGASSGNIKSGASFKFKFDKPGTYAYGCKYHPRMKGVITVK